MQLQQFVDASCSNPFEVLGPSFDSNLRKQHINVWLPGAIAVTVLDYAHHSPLVTLTKDEKHPYFHGEFSTDSQVIYRLKVTYPEGETEITDPYQFVQEAYHAVHYVDHKPQNVYQQLGAQLVSVTPEHGDVIEGTRFAVFAPNAHAVSLIGDFNYWDASCLPMQRTSLGYWVLFVPGIRAGARYKYRILANNGHELPHKADPVGFYAEQYPSHASVVYDHAVYKWQDANWQKKQAKANKYKQPMSIYEVHLGSWKRPDANADKRYLSYAELADDLLPYVKEMGYTHLEVLPVSEHPFDGSWGYQPVGLFAPTSRFGNPDEFKAFVDACHQANIGIIIDWVPAHFPEDPHGLARFDGSCVYEYEDPRRGWHPDWNSCIYDFGKDTVRQFLVANALYWIDKFHVDGLRVDAVASMLYLDYSRNEGEWIPNVDGGNENYEAISLLQWMNSEVYAQFPQAMTIAEESTSFPGVSRPVSEGGLGFGFKWNMGWMHDSLHYIAKDPAYRTYHHNEITFSMVYSFTENFILPISHDEVVHGKGSLLYKMPGDEWQQAANHRCYAGFMFAHPGKKLNFMGNELGQSSEWNHDGSVDWHLLQYDKHAGIQRLYRQLNQLYTHTPALYETDHDAKGFEWIDHQNDQQSILSLVRKSASGKQKVYAISNFTPVPREGFRMGVLDPGKYRVVLNTDHRDFWGSGFDIVAQAEAQQVSWNGRDWSIELTLPPLATLFILHQE